MKITIDQQQVQAETGQTILEIARQAGIHIPTLCYHPAFAGQGRCRMCMVEVEEKGKKRIVASCTYPVQSEEIQVRTTTPTIEKLRRTIVMFLYKKASGSELMQEMYREYGCSDNNLPKNPGERCILCNLCVQACEDLGHSAISLVMRGTDKQVATPYDEAAAACVGCGVCAEICPTGAIAVIEEENKRTIWNKEFELIPCQRCGKFFATREQWEDMVVKHSEYAGSEKLCEACRKKITAEKIQAFSQ